MRKVTVGLLLLTHHNLNFSKFFESIFKSFFSRRIIFSVFDRSYDVLVNILFLRFTEHGQLRFRAEIQIMKYFF